jgi:hypothetical protein
MSSTFLPAQYIHPLPFFTEEKCGLITVLHFKHRDFQGLCTPGNSSKGSIFDLRIIAMAALAEAFLRVSPLCFTAECLQGLVPWLLTELNTG